MKLESKYNKGDIVTFITRKDNTFEIYQDEITNLDVIKLARGAYLWEYDF